MSNWAPQHNESDLTRTKCWEGSVSHVRTHTGQQREQSHERIAFHQMLLAPRTINIENLNHDVLPRFWTLFCWGLQSTAPATKNEPERPKDRAPHKIIIVSQIKTYDRRKETRLKLKRRPSSPNTAPATKMISESTLHIDPRLPRFSQRAENATPATRMQMCPMSCTCHANHHFRLQKVQEVPHLPRKIDIAQKNKHRAPVRVDRRKRPNRYTHFARATAV